MRSASPAMAPLGRRRLSAIARDESQSRDLAAFPEEPVAEACGESLYGKQWVHGRDRKQLERLAHYILRLPIANERLSERPDGSLLLAFRRPWKDGTRALVLSAEDLLVRLCAAVPPPFFNMIRYYGVPSSHSAFRSRVVPVPAQAPGAHTPPPSLGDQLERARAEAEGSLSGVQGPASYAPTLGGSA